MKIKDLIERNPNVSFTLKAYELREIGRTIADNTVIDYLIGNDEELYTRKQVIRKFKVSSAALSKWMREDMIQCKKIGNRLYYPASEVERLARVWNR